MDGGSIQFKDPWFIDYSDPDYGNTLRNGGMDQATWRNRASPFYPNATISYENGHPNGQKYNGVFLNQPYTGNNPVYYSVKVDAEQLIPINGQDRKFYFFRWSGDPSKVELEDDDGLQTGVVFKDANAVVSAQLKGNLVSGQADAYSSNSQQKTVRDNNGYYHTVYTSMGMPWYTKSVTTDFGGNIITDANYAFTVCNYLLNT